MFKYSSTLAVCAPLNLSIILGFVSVNIARERTLWMRLAYAEKNYRLFLSVQLASSFIVIIIPITLCWILQKFQFDLFPSFYYV